MTQACDASAAQPEAPPGTPSPVCREKSAKKRKSWGQVLPEPKTNLPARKRAKTEDEKEQRRVERILRNRRAAQISRNRKRLDLQALKHRNTELQDMLVIHDKARLILMQELNRLRNGAGSITPPNTPTSDMSDGYIKLGDYLVRQTDGTVLDRPADMSTEVALDVGIDMFSAEIDAGSATSQGNQESGSDSMGKLETSIIIAGECLDDGFEQFLPDLSPYNVFSDENYFPNEDTEDIEPYYFNDVMSNSSSNTCLKCPVQSLDMQFDGHGSLTAGSFRLLNKQSVINQY